MNYNITTYCIFIPIIFFIMIKIGWLFYKYGDVFLLHLFQHNVALVKSINNLLLIGYYLLNLGYAIITIAHWEHIESITSMINSLATMLGKIIILLALMHYNNVLCLTYLIKTKTS